MSRILATVIAMLAMTAPAWAAGQELAIFRDVSRQVLQYSRYTVFDNVSAQVHEGVVTLSGRVTMPFKSEAIAPGSSTSTASSRCETRSLFFQCLSSTTSCGLRIARRSTATRTSGDTGRC